MTAWSLSTIVAHSRELSSNLPVFSGAILPEKLSGWRAGVSLGIHILLNRPFRVKGCTEFLVVRKYE